MSKEGGFLGFLSVLLKVVQAVMQFQSESVIVATNHLQNLNVGGYIVNCISVIVVTIEVLELYSGNTFLSPSPTHTHTHTYTSLHNYVEGTSTG